MQLSDRSSEGLLYIRGIGETHKIQRQGCQRRSSKGSPWISLLWLQLVLFPVLCLSLWWISTAAMYADQFQE